MKIDHTRARLRIVLGTTIGAMLIAAFPATQVFGQVLYSYESDLQGWGPDTGGGTVTQSTIGATNGTKSMSILAGASGYTSDAIVTENAGSTVYNAIAATAGDGKLYDLRADVTFGPQSWTNISSPSDYFQVRLDSNSNGGFISNTLFQVPQNTVRTFKTATPLLKVFPDPSSMGFAQLRFGKNSDYGAATPGQGVPYYVDNVHLQQITESPVSTWEDVTPGVDNFDNWKDGFSGTASMRKIVRTTDSDPYGITQGTSAMQVVEPATGFNWGAQYVLDGSSPAGQLQALGNNLNTGSAIRFDVTIPNDYFGVTNAALGTGSSLPGYLNLYLSVNDGNHFFQSFDKPINLAEGATTTVTIPMDELRDVSNSSINLASQHVAGPGGVGDPTFLQIGLATGTDGIAAFAIDNFRIIHDVVPGIVGDYNSDGVVDAADYVVWRAHLGQTFSLPNRDPANGSGVISAADYNSWKGAFGAHSGSGSFSNSGAVPEPATISLGLLGAIVLSFATRRRIHTMAAN